MTDLTKPQVEDAIKALNERRMRLRGRPKQGQSSSVKTLYVPPEILQVWDSFAEIVAKEGKSVSQAIVDMVCTHVKEHFPGNPQTILEPTDPEGRSLSELQREALNLPKLQGIFFEQVIECENCHMKHKSQVMCYGKPEEFHE